MVSKRVVLADVPPERKPERGYVQMFPRNEIRNGGTFACSLGTKTRTRVRSPKPPFYETALLSPGENGYDVANCRWMRLFYLQLRSFYLRFVFFTTVGEP